MVINYNSDSKVIFHEFNRQTEEEEVVIQSPKTGVSLVLPIEALEIIDGLLDEKTIGEVKNDYYDKHREIPDIEDLLIVLYEEGFIYSSTDDVTTKNLKKNVNSPQYHFEKFPQSLARIICSRQVGIVCITLIILGGVITFYEPNILPSWRVYFFTENSSSMWLTLVCLNYFTLFLHELSHLIGARAVGVSSRMGISHRLWYLVAETDISGVWSIPRNQRYLPIIVGPIYDSTSAAILILISWMSVHNWLIVNSTILIFCRALLLTHLTRLLWQCYFFLRTDFYFLLANHLRCRSLMQDTETLLSNYCSRYLKNFKYKDISHIPQNEMRIVRVYAVLWVIGRLAAFIYLWFVSIPLLSSYCQQIYLAAQAGWMGNHYKFIDAVLIFFLVLTPYLLGFGLWFRSLYLSWR